MEDIKKDFREIFLDLYKNYKGKRIVWTIDGYYTMQVAKEDGTPIGIGLKEDLSAFRIYGIDEEYEDPSDKKKFVKIFTLRILGSKGPYPKLSFNFHKYK